MLKERSHTVMKKYKPFEGEKQTLQRKKFFDRHFGKDNWEFAFKYSSSPMKEEFISFEEGLDIITRSYELFFKKCSTHLSEDFNNFLSIAKDVYETNTSNVVSGLDFIAQEQKQDEHYFDIAIRRALNNIGESFQGDKLVHIYANEFSDLINPKQIYCPNFARESSQEVIVNPKSESEKSVYSFFMNNQYIKAKNTKNVSLASLAGTFLL